MQNQFAFSGSTNASCIAATRSTAIKKTPDEIIRGKSSINR
jgi:hypothetical protein